MSRKKHQDMNRSERSANGKRIIIIGGGISGLSSGIYARLNGFDSLILEKTVNLGGECTGWWRQGFHIDNSIHWLTGTNHDKDIYKVWCQVGALGPEIRTIPVDPFFSVDLPSGRVFHLHQDLGKLKEEMLEIAPEDKEEIDRFISAVKGYQKMEVTARMPYDLGTPGFFAHTVWSMRGAIVPHVKYAKMTIREYSKLFKNEDLRYMINAYFPRDYYAEAMLYIFGIITSGNGNLPEGGSLALAERMAAKYSALGGESRTLAEVTSLDIEDGRVKAVILKNGERIEADYVVSACPINVLLEKILKGEYKDRYFDRRMASLSDHPIFSNAVVYFGCEGDAAEVRDNSIVTVNGFRAARRMHHSFLLHHYAHEKGFAPEGHFVCQAMVMQYGADFDAWKAYNDESPALYREKKKEFAEQMQRSLEERFPSLRGKTKILEVITPLSFYKRCGPYKGGYMSFIRTPLAGTENHNGRIEGISNLQASGQWGLTGGMPAAVTSGKFAIQRICHDEKITFKGE